MKKLSKSKIIGLMISAAALIFLCVLLTSLIMGAVCYNPFLRNKDYNGDKSTDNKLSRIHNISSEFMFPELHSTTVELKKNGWLNFASYNATVTLNEYYANVGPTTPYIYTEFKIKCGKADDSHTLAQTPFFHTVVKNKDLSVTKNYSNIADDKYYFCYFSLPEKVSDTDINLNNFYNTYLSNQNLEGGFIGIETGTSSNDIILNQKLDSLTALNKINVTDKIASLLSDKISLGIVKTSYLKGLHSQYDETVMDVLDVESLTKTQNYLKANGNNITYFCIILKGNDIDKYLSEYDELTLFKFRELNPNYHD